MLVLDRKTVTAWSTGELASMYPAISTADLMRIPFALPDENECDEIAAKVRESFSARGEAHRLLDEAKAMVETAILGQE